MRITEPGVYDMPAEDYHADPCPVPSLSSSIAKLLIGATPQHAFTAHPRLNPAFERDEDDKFNIGNATHMLVLNDVKKFAVFQGDSWRGKDAAMHKERARAAGRVPLLESQLERVISMANALRAQLDVHADASDAFTDGKPEQTLIWVEDDTWFRIRLDWLRDDRRNPFDDYKTSASANPDAWESIVRSVGHDIQASFYRRGIRALKINRDPKFRFIVQEPKEPFCMSSINLSSTFMELADRRVEQAIARWRWCLSKNQWPGYIGRTVTIEPRGYHETQLMERELRDAELAKDAPDGELLALGLAMQAPL